ncbi:MAG: VWA domain-containing protein [Acidobacteriota bacterium]
MAAVRPASCLAIGLTLVASGSGASSAGGDSATPLAAQQRPAFEATVTRVRVDVIVTDASGRFVDDLKPEEFRLLEDGKPQQILGWQLVDLGAGQVADLAAGGRGKAPLGATPAVEPGRAPGAALDDSVPAGAASELGAMIFLIDGQGLDRSAKRRFSDTWAKLLDKTTGLRIPRAAYMVDAVGRLRELSPLSLDVVPLRRAAEAVQEEPTPGTTIRRRLIEIARDIQSIADGFTSPFEVEMKARSYESDERDRSLQTLELLTQFCHALASREGRTALVWVSSGVKLMEGGPFAALLTEDAQSERLATPAGDDRTSRGGKYGTNIQFGSFSPDSRLLRRQQQLQEAANSANVSIYGVDPTLTSEMLVSDVDVRTRTAGASQLLSSPQVRGSLEGLRDSLKNAAAATGGRAFVHWSDLSTALETIEADTSKFYLLTYAPPGPEGDGEYHRIKVEVRRPDLAVRERSGYLDISAEERETRKVAAALALPGAVSGLPIAAAAFRKWSAQGQPVVEMVATISQPAPQGAAAANPAFMPLRFHAVVVKDDGDIVEEVHEEVRPRRAPAAGQPSSFPSLPLYVHEWELQPGEYELRVAVEDVASGRLGATGLRVKIPELSSDWRSSDPILMESDGISRPRPVLDGRLIFGGRAAVYVEVAAGRQPIVSGEIFNREGTARLAQLAPVVLAVDPSGIHRGALPLPAPLSPGDYMLQVTLTDPPARKHAVFRLPFEISGS